MDNAKTLSIEGELSLPEEESTNERQQEKPSSKSKRKRDDTNDVLYLKGAAAQQTVHPGNLNYYALCEQRFDEWSTLDCDDPKRKQICKEIVKVILQRGGVFHKPSGGALDVKAAVEKTNSRFRQIAKPKLRIHTGMYGENDVVFAKGARNHMYPGNAKWRTLLDGFAQSYHRDIANIVEKRKAFGPFQPRPGYMSTIVEETISIIEERGGKFLDEKLKPLSHNVIVAKTHARFKDIKKEIKAGKLVLNAANKRSGEDNSIGEVKAAVLDESATIKVPTRELVTPGFTSVKTTVSSKKEGRKVIAKNMRRRGKKFYGNQHETADEVELDDMSIPSIPSDESEEEEDRVVDNDDEGKDEEEFKDLSRHGRRKSRASGLPVPPKQKKKSKRTNQAKKERIRSPSPEHTLSEYEQMRLAKIKRNRKRLEDLGLGIM